MATDGRHTGYGRPVLTGHVGGPGPTLRQFHVPVKSGPARTINLRDGSMGFLIVHFILWWHEVVHPINVGIWDEWGWASRPVRGQAVVLSEHAGGTAADVDATLHPRGRSVAATFKAWQVVKIRARLNLYRTKSLRRVLGWGGNYVHTVDGMHVELASGATLADAEQVARRLLTTPRGKRILDANPGLRSVILS